VNILHNGTGPDDQTTPVRSLAELEQIVKTGLATYQEVGAALDEIKSRALYKETHPTFEAYLQEKWQMSLSNGYRKIAAARLAANSPMGEKPPTERAARKLISDARRAKKPKQPKQPVKVKAESTVSGPVNRTTLAQIMANSPDPEEQTVEEEFEKFKAYLWDWEMDLSKDDYLRLVTKIYEHTDEIRIKTGWTDDVLIARENARLDAQEAAKAAAEMAVAV
jgi:hypothetical protein